MLSLAEHAMITALDKNTYPAGTEPGPKGAQGARHNRTTQNYITCRGCGRPLINTSALANHLASRSGQSCCTYYQRNTPLIKAYDEILIRETLHVDRSTATGELLWCIIGVTITGRKHICTSESKKSVIEARFARIMKKKRGR